MIKPRMPNAFELLMTWHGLFVGAYTIAYLTADGSLGLHRFAGYSALVLLALRLLAAFAAGDRAPWALPLPKASMWNNFLRKFATNPLGALRGRTPFAPLSGLVILGALVAVTISGLAADWWEWEDLHEGLAEGSLTIVLIHIAIVSFAPLWKKLAESRSGPAASPLTRQA